MKTRELMIDRINEVDANKVYDVNTDDLTDKELISFFEKLLKGLYQQ
jgi:hypothetical protein